MEAQTRNITADVNGYLSALDAMSTTELYLRYQEAEGRGYQWLRDAIGAILDKRDA